MEAFSKQTEILILMVRDYNKDEDFEINNSDNIGLFWYTDTQDIQSKVIMKSFDFVL